jgi:hypothetical protein
MSLFQAFFSELDPPEKATVLEPSMVIGQDGTYYVRSFRVGRGPRATTRGLACAAFMDAHGYGRGFVLADGPHGPEVRVV